MKRIPQYYLVGVFFLLISAPLLNHAFHFVSFKRVSENRRFCDSLTFDVGKLDAFPESFAGYINDNFPFRTPLITLDKQVNFYWLKISPNSQDLFIGENGRYFVMGVERRMYEGFSNYSHEQLDAFESEWRYRKHYFDSLGIVVKLLPGPTAFEIYPEDLPFYIQKSNSPAILSQLRKAIDKAAPGVFVDPVPMLLAEKEHANMYYYLDHHWTNKAGHAVTRLLLGDLKRDFPELSSSYLDQYKWRKQRKTDGYVKDLLGVSELSEQADYQYGYSEAKIADNYPFTFNVEGISADQQQFHFVNKKAKNKLKVLVIRDSFGNAVYPFLKEAFAETVIIFDSWSYGLNKSVVESYRPDLVIYISYEPHMKSFITNKSH